MDLHKIAQDNLILKFRSGSHLYGTNTPDSDEDYVGVFLPPKEYVYGLKKVEQVEVRTNPTSSGKGNTKEDVDTVYYSLPKFLHLVTENNPNMLELLFAHENCVLFLNSLGQKLLENRELFVSLRVKHKFCGYAYSQRHKVMNGLRTVAKLKDWGVKTVEEVTPEMYAELKDETLKSGSRLKYLLDYGYDVKFASHLLRLLYFGIEFLKEGKLTLPTQYNNFLRDVKQGKYPLEEVLKKAEQLEQLVEMAYLNSKLPHTPNMDEVEKLQMELLEFGWWRQANLF